MMLLRIVDKFNRVCKKRKLKVDVGKNNVIVFESPREQILQSHTDFEKRAGQCKI